MESTSVCLIGKFDFEKRFSQMPLLLVLLGFCLWLAFKPIEKWLLGILLRSLKLIRC